MTQVTQEDVKLLNEGASPQKRAGLARKIALDLDTHELSDTERELAYAICQKLAEDVDQTVREALAQSFKDSKDLPRETALLLAEDVLVVSLPILQFSQVLEDDDLIAITREGDPSRQIAISHRTNLSGSVSAELIELGTEKVVDSVLQNESAQIAETSMETALERFQASEVIHDSLARRHDLPLSVVEKMVDLVADSLKAELVAKHGLSSVMLERLVLESREEAKKRLFETPHKKRDAMGLVRALDQHGQLTPDLIFRALEIGDRPFFESALAHRVGIPLENARKLIKDRGDKGFSALYFKAGLPRDDFQPIKFMVESEYHAARHSPITRSQKDKTYVPESWVTETEKPKKGWKLF